MYEYQPKWCRWRWRRKLNIKFLYHSKTIKKPIFLHYNYTHMFLHFFFFFTNFTFIPLQPLLYITLSSPTRLQNFGCASKTQSHMELIKISWSVPLICNRGITVQRRTNSRKRTPLGCKGAAEGCWCFWISLNCGKFHTEFSGFRTSDFLCRCSSEYFFPADDKMSDSPSHFETHALIIFSAIDDGMIDSAFVTCLNTVVIIQT